MKNIIAIVMIMTFLGCSTIQGIKEINNVLLYKKFIVAGTPARVNSSFNHPDLYQNTIDTQPNELYLDKKQLETSLRTAHVKKYIPQKIAGITLAGEFYTGNTKHFFLYFQSGRLIDFSEKKIYILKDSLTFNKK